MQRIRKVLPIHRKKKKITETALKKVQTLNLLHKGFKSTALNVLKELIETMDKNTPVIKKVVREC
jgi:hypothetical protein